jgi:hypothetical protein
MNPRDEVIRAGDMAEKLLKSKVWKEIVSPLMDKMVSDSLGGKNGDTYTLSAEQLKTMSEGELKYNLGWCDGIMTLHNNIFQVVKDRDTLLHQEYLNSQIEKDINAETPYKLD